ncbi:MAG: transglutaminase family protein, partial [Ilumatobacteraceae bacterium]
MRYRVRHSTEYRYSAQVINGHTVAHLRPRLTPTQTVRESEVTTVPAADHADEYLDVFGNHVSYRAVEQVHDQLVVVAQSEVDITQPVELLWSPPWEEVRSIVATDGSPDGLLARMCSIESTLVTPSADLARFASWSFLPGRPFHEAVVDLSHRIFAEFAFDPGFSDVTTPLAEVLTHRRGVCQDFAHLAIGTMRSLGLPARYVSGYVENEPSP